MKSIIVSFCLLFAIQACAQDSLQSKQFKKCKFAFGVLGNHRAIGLQVEYKFYRNFALRALGAKVLGYDKPTEYGYAGIGLISYYFPTDVRFIEPVIGIGCIYTLYHWDIAGRSGNLSDINIGGGFGTNFRFSNHFRTGVNIFLANNYNTEYKKGEMNISSRKLLILPTLTLDLLF